MNDRLFSDPGSAAHPQTETQAGQPSLTSLVSGIVADVQQLVRQEINLARTEVKQEWEKAKTAAGALMGGVVLLAVGGVLLCFMLVYLIHYFGVPLWASFGIWGGVLVLCGAVLVGLGYSRASHVNLIPPQTAQTLKENVQWIKNQT
jgi:uncharacterized membrane protein YqjE